MGQGTVLTPPRFLARWGSHWSCVPASLIRLADYLLLSFITEFILIFFQELSEVEIAREEVREECGYLLPPGRLTRIVTFPSSVGSSGQLQEQTMF